MRRIFLMILILSFMVCQISSAGERKSNIWASWVNATATTTTLTMPINPTWGDFTISNGDSTDPVCVNLKGNPITDACVSNKFETVQIEAGGELVMYDYETSAITIRNIVNAASPINVIVNY